MPGPTSTTSPPAGSPADRVPDHVVMLTSLLGAQVVGPVGQQLGRLTDVTVGFAQAPPPVVRARVGRGRRAGYLPWERLRPPSDATDGKWVALGLPVRPPAPDEPLAADELSLATDVLDVQVVDVAGHRVARVSDVVLGEGGSRLELIGVDVGIGSLSRRIGFRWGDRRPLAIVPVDRLHLTSGRGHQLQLDAPWSAVHAASAVELAHLLDRLDAAKTVDVVSAVGAQRAADALLTAQPPVGGRVMRTLPSHLAAQVRRHLPPESRHTHPDLHEDLPPVRRLRRLDGWRKGHPGPGAGRP